MFAIQSPKTRGNLRRGNTSNEDLSPAEKDMEVVNFLFASVLNFFDIEIRFHTHAGAGLRPPPPSMIFFD